MKITLDTKWRRLPLSLTMVLHMHIYSFPDPSEKGDDVNVPANASKSKKKADKAPPHRDNKSRFSHPWLSSSLKGHNENVLDMSFSPNGKYLASCSSGKSVCPVALPSYWGYLMLSLPSQN